MQHFSIENIKFETIKTFIRLKMEQNYCKAFSKIEPVTKGVQFNINEFTNLFTNNLISDYYKEINHDMDNGELIYKKIMDINKTIKDKISGCVFNSEFYKKKNKFFKFDILNSCMECDFYLSLKNIQYMENIIKPYIDINIKIYAIDKIFNLNDFIEFNSETSNYTFDKLIFGESKCRYKNLKKNII